MEPLRCGRCRDKYEGDPFAISLCDTCFTLMTEEQGYSERELERRYPPKGDGDADF